MSRFFVATLSVSLLGYAGWYIYNDKRERKEKTYIDFIYCKA